MYWVPVRVVGEAFEPTSGTLLLSKRSLTPLMVAELTTPLTASTRSCLTSFSAAALPESAVSPSSAITISTSRPPSLPPCRST